MKRKIFRLMAVAMMLTGMAVLLAPSAGQAITITSVVVTTTGGPYNVWTYPIVLAPGDSALLSQTGTTTGAYNFDTSDPCIGGGCTVGATITVTTDLGVFVYTDSAQILTNPVVDHVVDPPRETREYIQATGGSSLLQLFIGYADDAHLQSTHTNCNDPGLDCRPDPFTASPGLNHFQATLVTGFCLGATDPCIDAGVLRFVATVVTVPEPSALLLLGAGLVGLAAWGRKRMQS